MNSSLSILKKGIILIAVPLAFELAFFALVLRTQAQVAEAQDWALHTKVVLAQVEALYRRLAEGQGALARLVLTGDLGRYAKAERSIHEVARDSSELVGLVRDNGDQQAKARNIAAEAAALAGWQEGVARLVRDGRRDEAIERVKDPSAPGRLDAVRATIDGFRAEEDRLDRERTGLLAARTRTQAALMIAGGLGSVVGTVALLAYFSRGIARRFAVLGENARRLAEGHELAPPLAGSDEIAALDRVFHEMARSIDEKDRENELFIYSVSHDLRSPLVNLQGFSQELGLASADLRGLLEDESVPGPIRKRGLVIIDREVADSIQFIQTAVSRLSVIIDALLRLSRAGRVEYRWQPVDVGATVRRVVEALGATIAGRGAKVAAGPMPPAWGDPTAIEQVFANLVGNAVNYLDPARPGEVEVGVLDGDGQDPSIAPGHLTYYVRDNGLGIPESGMSKLFLAFQRFHEGRAKGEGIGLALVRKIVERHGGRIRVESERGVGTTFFVELPGPPRDAQAGPSPHPPAAREAAR
jgi:signal transduction histidine kinase